jgi:hypothetical protein
MMKLQDGMSDGAFTIRNMANAIRKDKSKIEDKSGSWEKEVIEELEQSNGGNWKESLNRGSADVEENTGR